MAGSIGKTGNATVERKGQTRGTLYGTNNKTQAVGRTKPTNENNGK